MARPPLRRTPPITLALTAALLMLGSPGFAADRDDVPAPPPARVPADLLQHRIDEAQTKARFQEKLRQGEAEAIATPNQSQYDVTHYDLNLTLTPTTHILSGTVTVQAQVVSGPITTMDLDLKSNLAVSAVTSGGLASTFSRVGNVLTVNLDHAYATSEAVVVTVTYSGNPTGESFGWDTWNGQNMIWTLSEPFGAREWWPCKDQNRDKADSVDMTVTVPDNLVVASNGTLVSDVDNGATRTVHWHTSSPIATYLVSLAIHPYTVFSHWYTPQAGGSPMEVRYFVFPDHYASVQATYALTVPMIDAYAQAWGEYPFLSEKYGHAEFVWGGGMEHQTLTSLGGWSEDLISHELAHQWWGDMITCDDFHHIWLNEGFATWAEAYWKETTSGPATYRDYMDAAAYFGPGTVYVEDLSNFNAIFDSNLSYNKASWVLHMVRGALGDTDFFAGLHHYRDLYEGKTATTEQFRDAMEDVSGRDLDAFFQQWIYGEYFPVYRYSWSPSAGGIDLTVDQIQTNTGLFTMPIPIRVQSTAGTFDFTVENAAASESYSIAVAGDVQDVQLDPDRWILRQVESTVSNPTFDHGILLVNGVDWSNYGTEITTAYADSAFWNDNPITFWDTFAAPPGGYPANLPAPLGHGAVPAGILGQYSAVIWVGNNFNGDLADWAETPIESYLGVGGNVLLMSRMGQSFIDASLAAYLGITWSGTGITLNNCTAQVAGLTNIAFIGSQSLNDTFSPTVGPNSTLLYRDTVGATRGTGVIVQPPGGGSVRHDGGKCIFLAARPYRMNHAQLRTNVDYMLTNYFGEPYSSPTPAVEAPRSVGFALAPNRPNPFSGQTVIPFSLPVAGRAELSVYDVGGRRIRTLVSGPQAAGERQARWDARDERGALVAPGVYFVRLEGAGHAVSRPIVLLR